ncbi:MAG: hypothetical protein LC791_20395, partial [Acidobacteria bacterium]|nr:hypothetical protein [Acidobacteriota bacterium]
MIRRLTRLCAGLLVCAGSWLTVEAQDPATLPRLDASALRYVGAFTLPAGGSGASSLQWGRGPLGMGPDGQSLYVSCHDQYDR